MRLRQLTCQTCGWRFSEKGQHQVSLKHIATQEDLLVRVATGALELDVNSQRFRRDLPPGEMHDGLYVNDEGLGLVLIGRYVVRRTDATLKPYAVYRFADAGLAAKAFAAFGTAARLQQTDSLASGRERAVVARRILMDQEKWLGGRQRPHLVAAPTKKATSAR